MHYKFYEEGLSSSSNIVLSVKTIQKDHWKRSRFRNPIVFHQLYIITSFLKECHHMMKNLNLRTERNNIWGTLIKITRSTVKFQDLLTYCHIPFFQEYQRVV